MTAGHGAEDGAEGGAAATLVWEDAARRAVEQETIYLRERLRGRAEALARGAGRRRVTPDDVAQARRMPSGMPAREAPPVAEPAWPVTFGAYRVLDPAGAVALCTLASEALVDALAARRPPGVAIVGRVFTENFGVEKVVTNLVANPCLRVLVLCGTESRHRVGETLLALHARGVDAAGRVIGTSSPLPLVRSLAPEAVRIYQQKLELVDLRGEDRADAILDAVGSRVAQAPPPWPERWEPPVAVLRLPGGPGAMGGRFTPDPAGLFLIGLGPSGRTIHAEHYTREGVLDRRLVGDSARAVADAVLREGLVGDAGHAAYLGRELQKAEVALHLGLPYEQDRDLDLPARGG
jgi:tetrahydromethanopterin S-methyltransferase subunit A